MTELSEVYYDILKILHKKQIIEKCNINFMIQYIKDQWKLSCSSCLYCTVMTNMTICIHLSYIDSESQSYIIFLYLFLSGILPAYNDILLKV